MDDNKKEVWKPVKGYEGKYEVSDLGRVRSVDRVVNCRGGTKPHKGRILKSYISHGGYECIQLGHKEKKMLVHRLVGESFLFSINDRRQVNHKNGIKTDNRLENLEWCTQSENMKHAYRTGLQKGKGLKLGDSHMAKPITVNAITGQHVGDYPCIMSASLELGLSYRGIRRVLSGERKKYKSMVFTYIKKQ